MRPYAFLKIVIKVIKEIVLINGCDFESKEWGKSGKILKTK